MSATTAAKPKGNVKTAIGIDLYPALITLVHGTLLGTDALIGKFLEAAEHKKVTKAALTRLLKDSAFCVREIREPYTQQRRFVNQSVLEEYSLLDLPMPEADKPSKKTKKAAAAAPTAAPAVPTAAPAAPTPTLVVAPVATEAAAAAADVSDMAMGVTDDDAAAMALEEAAVGTMIENDAAAMALDADAVDDTAEMEIPPETLAVTVAETPAADAAAVEPIAAETLAEDTPSVEAPAVAEESVVDEGVAELAPAEPGGGSGTGVQPEDANGGESSHRERAASKRSRSESKSPTNQPSVKHHAADAPTEETNCTGHPPPPTPCRPIPKPWVRGLLLLDVLLLPRTTFQTQAPQHPWTTVMHHWNQRGLEENVEHLHLRPTNPIRRREQK
jgi:hypothetical protein